MNIETVLLIVIVTFACGFVLDRWNVRLSRSRRRQAHCAKPRFCRTAGAGGSLEGGGAKALQAADPDLSLIHI